MNMETGYELNVPVGDDNKDVKAIISNNEVIWERAIPTPKSGVAPLLFRATRAKPLLDWEITGKTYQAWTPSPEPQVGNNKLDNSKIEKSATVTNFAYTDSSVNFGSMTVGSVINSVEIKAEDTSYAFSFMGDTNKVTFALRCYNSSHTYLGDANKIFDETGRAVMTTLANTVYVRLYITSTVQGNISLTNLMLNKGNTVMTFEPFGYLPNTGACPVQGVGDYDAVTGKYKIPVVTRGKNLSPLNAISNIGWAKSYPNLVPVFNSLTKGKCCVTFDVTLNDITKPEKFSSSFARMIVTNPSGGLSMIAYWAGKQIGDTITLAAIFTITDANIGKFTNVYFYGCGNDQDAACGICDIKNIQLELGDTATEYEPYIEPITTPIYINSPLMADEVIDSTGNKEVLWRKLVLTGDESWTEYGGNYFTNAIDGKFKSISIIYSSHFPNNKQNGITLGGATEISALRLANDNRWSSTTELRSFLRAEYANGTPVTVWYQLATPTSETVSVPQIPTLKGNCIIDVDTEVKAKNMDADYLSSEKSPDGVPLRTGDGEILYTADNEPLTTER